MITRYEQVAGFLALYMLGLSTLLSKEVSASTTAYIETNIGVSQFAFGAICILFSIPIWLRRVNYGGYFALLFPFHGYFVANGRYVYLAHLSSNVPALLFVLAVALNWMNLVRLYRFVSYRVKHHDKLTTPRRA